MKFTIICCLLALALSSPGVDLSKSVPLMQNIGESCDKSAVYNITGFNVTPYPFAPSQQYSIAITGIFLDKDYVDQIYIGTKLDRHDWTYTYQEVQKEYTKGTVANFTVSIQAPSLKGSYTGQISYHRSDFSVLSCWQYSYNLA